eukprot:4412321-Amphidinium_carterae.1
MARHMHASYLCYRSEQELSHCSSLVKHDVVDDDDDEDDDDNDDDNDDDSQLHIIYDESTCKACSKVQPAFLESEPCPIGQRNAEGRPGGLQLCRRRRARIENPELHRLLWTSPKVLSSLCLGFGTRNLALFNPLSCPSFWNGVYCSTLHAQHQSAKAFCISRREHALLVMYVRVFSAVNSAKITVSRLVTSLRTADAAPPQFSRQPFFFGDHFLKRLGKD